MVANTGTYLDSPFHRYAEGNDLARLPLESLADLAGHRGPASVRAGSRESTPTRSRASTCGGKAVLIHTGWDRHWRTEAL